MRQRKGRRLGLLLIGAAVAGACALVASAAWAASPSVSIGSGSAAPGGQVSVDLNSHSVGTPGLAAWSIDISYDTAVVTPVSCVTEHGAVCNTHFRSDTVRTAGATAVGIMGDTKLATITFQCAQHDGESLIRISLPDFADATLGGPRQIDAGIDNGRVTCSTTPRVPTTGSAEPQNGSSFAWLIVSLAAAGAMGLAAGYGTLRARSSRN
jgi:hypothetical protein